MAQGAEGHFFQTLRLTFFLRRASLLFWQGKPPHAAQEVLVLVGKTPVVFAFDGFDPSILLFATEAGEASHVLGASSADFIVVNLRGCTMRPRERRGTGVALHCG